VGTSADRTRVAAAIRRIQAQLCDGLEAFELEHGSSARFGSDVWERPGGGGGLTRVISGGAVLEKGGVNVSEVHGELAAEVAAQLPGSGTQFFATGVSMVLHPESPHVPTCHANFRYFERGGTAWFGGGADLTPYYFHDEDKQHFHGVWKRVCERHADVADHRVFADECDRYFHLPHRGERRGVGGIFFDHLGADGQAPLDRLLTFVQEAGPAVLEAWLPIAARRLATPVTDRQRRWHELRRGRYVEFNLIYDRGTVFGLKTAGRVESILMSLPPRVRWEYCVEPEPGTPEHALLVELRRPLPGASG
jgi:coproporphyrinogen III oxidase